MRSLGGSRPLRGTVALSPPAVLACLYGGLILIGTLLLKLPMATVGPLAWDDAFFTATSAVTVTGLTVFDVATRLTGFGEVVLMVLFQLGGLGLMTFAVLVLLLLGQPLGVRQRLILREDLGQTSFQELLSLVLVILRVVLLFELAGTLLLALRWVPEFGLGRGSFLALFHAVSAFNNAGFALFPDSLERYAGDPIVNLTVPLLLIAGALGYSVLSEVTVKRRWRHFSLHTRLMLVGNLVLLGVGFVAIAALEWGNPATLGAAPVWTRLMAAWFQAVTPRSGGLSTIDIGGLHDSTSVIVMGLMLIGGGTTSTAGGIKVTSAFVLALATVAYLRQRREPRIFGRSIAPGDVLKVLALTSISVFAVFLGTFLLTLTHDGEFLDVAFEALSALATVGLSRGATAEAGGLDHLVLCLLMFIGRVGPLAFALSFAARAESRIRYPEGRVYVG